MGGSVVILGGGMIGAAMARDLVRGGGFAVTVGDVRGDVLARVAERTGARTLQADLGTPDVDAVRRGSINLARHIARCIFLISRQLSELIPILKDNCNPDEYQAYTKGIATAIAHINFELMNKICAEYPQVEKEIEADVAKYGRFL